MLAGIGCRHGNSTSRSRCSAARPSAQGCTPCPADRNQPGAGKSGAGKARRSCRACPALGDNDRVTLNLQRIPPDGDSAAEEIIALARDGVTADLLGCLVRRDATTLGRYGTRHATLALRAHSAALLHDALLAKAIADIIHESDWRDTLVGLALHYYVAQQLGLDPAEVFDAAVSSLPDDRVCSLFRRFGARKDVTLEAFGWLLVETDDGPDFEPRLARVLQEHPNPHTGTRAATPQVPGRKVRHPGR